MSTSILWFTDLFYTEANLATEAPKLHLFQVQSPSGQRKPQPSGSQVQASQGRVPVGPVEVGSLFLHKPAPTENRVLVYPITAPTETREIGLFGGQFPKDWVSFPSGTVVKNLPANRGDTREVGLLKGLGRSLGEGNGNPLQYSCMENPMDRGAWQATVHEVTNCWTSLITQQNTEQKIPQILTKCVYAHCFHKVDTIDNNNWINNTDSFQSWNSAGRGKITTYVSEITEHALFIWFACAKMFLWTCC